MAKFPTYPTLYDEVKTISITDLKRMDYFVPGQWRAGNIIWKRGERETGSIRVSVDVKETSGYLELSYNYRDQPVKYKAPIVSIPSNLGKGLIWLFLCPYTGKRCRKLYGIGKYFFHREAFKGCMYECQTRAKNSRELSKTLEMVYTLEKFQRERKQLRRYYNRKPTKRYLKYLKMQRRATEKLKTFNVMDYL